ncbi:MAG: MBL fold metallo-hydrolase [Synergistaceae bacterium]|nr:MBL fold metallo-hydrolase [Synergistaceae bacterium]
METAITGDCKNGVYCVDSGYEGGGVASVYLLRDGNEAAIVDTCHNGALEPVKRAFSELGVKDGEVKYIFITHVHLDHMGGAGLFAREFPEAALVVHERGGKHLADPSKLAASAAGVYGESVMKRLYGDILPIPADRITMPRDGAEFRVGDRTIVCFDTPGHARHHIAYKDTSSGAVFTGDAYGMSYAELVRPDGRCAILTTSPVRFDPNAMRASMRLLDGLANGEVYPTHFGRLPLGGGVSDSLYRQLDMYVEAAERAEGDIASIRMRLREIFIEEASRQNCPSLASDFGRVTRAALELNAQGLALWYKKSRDESKSLNA